MGEEDDGPEMNGFFGLNRGGPAVRFQDPIDRELAQLERRVEAMRRLGVVRWKGIEVGPAPRPSAEPIVLKEPRPASAFEVHMKYWGRMRRSSGAPLPDCSKHCPCGGWKLSNDPGSVGK